jgi:hypothetical protein
MLMRYYVKIGAKTPYTVVPNDPVDISSVVQPFEHAIQCNPVQSVRPLEPALKVMMADSPVLLEEHGKNLDPPGSHPLRPAPDHLFRLLPETRKHKGSIATKLRYFSQAITLGQPEETQVSSLSETKVSPSAGYSTSGRCSMR